MPGHFSHWQSCFRRKKTNHRGKTWAWIRRCEEKGYFSDIVRELRTEDTVDFKATLPMSYEGFKVIVHVRRRFHKGIVVVPSKRIQQFCATLRRLQNNRNDGTCCSKSLTGFKLSQQVSTLLWFHANGPKMLGPTMMRVVGQQCCVRLHGP